MKILTKKDIKLKDLRTELVGYSTREVYIEIWKNHERYKCYLGRDSGPEEVVKLRTYRYWKNTEREEINEIRCVCNYGSRKGEVRRNRI